MSDTPPPDDRLETGPLVQRRNGRDAVTQEEIDDVLGDERLSPQERQARLTDLRQRLLDDEHADGDESYAPLQTRIMDALSMLAEGGHDYDGHLHVEGEPADPRSTRGDTDRDL